MSETIAYKKLELFYKYNLKIKKIIYSLLPTEYNNDEYYENFRVKTMDMIDELKKLFDDLIEILDFHLDEKEYVNILFDKCQNELRKTKKDINSIDEFFHKNIYDMDEELIKTTRHQTYAIGGSSSLLIPKVKTINELLFVIHCSVNNDLNLYQNIPVTDEKNNINIRGEETELSRSIYDSLSSDITPGFIEIISLKNINKVLILVSKRGHATTIEITENKDIIDVNYFIPRLYNRKMINDLRGVTRVTENDYYAIGAFRCNKNNITNEIVKLINGIPMDKHMFLEGGIFNKRGF